MHKNHITSKIKNKSKFNNNNQDLFESLINDNEDNENYEVNIKKEKYTSINKKQKKADIPQHIVLNKIIFKSSS